MKKLVFEAGSWVIRAFRRYRYTGDESDYRELYSVESIAGKQFFNIGAGSFYHPCWTNIDGESDFYLNSQDRKTQSLVVDLMEKQPLPVASGTAELVYSSHTIEHINDEAVSVLLGECYRMLKPGGILRLVTPDMDLYYKAWKRRDKKFFFWKNDQEMNNDYRKFGLNRPIREASITQLFLEEFASSVSEIVFEGASERISDTELERLFHEKPYEEVFDYCCHLCPVELQKKYPFRHMNWFNEQKLISMLGAAGFSNVYRSAYLQSSAHVLRNPVYFDQTVPGLSLYVEAVK